MSIFKAHIRQMSAYKPPLEGRSPDQHLLLDFNERTIPVSQPIIDALTITSTAGVCKPTRLMEISLSNLPIIVALMSSRS